MPSESGTFEPLHVGVPRIAYCTDTFEEANGVATVSRAFLAYAKRNQLPLLVIRPGRACQSFMEGSVRIVEVSKSALSIPLDMGLRFDLLIFRKADWLREQMNAFHPDIVHITGPGDIGMVCARLSHTLRVPKPPLVAAWHTNVHQYARLRAARLLRMMPRGMATSAGSWIERNSFRWAARFYQTARLILAPNQEILDQLTKRTGKPGRTMPHGVDSDLYAPSKRTAGEPLVTLGYAGRLTAEKNVRLLAEVVARLPREAKDRVRFLIVGDGAERQWLAHHLPKNAEFTGMLRGEELARAYARMDLFLFPSQSDTFGLVMLEAMATGIPVVSFRVVGPNSVVTNGFDGYAADEIEEFVGAVRRLVEDQRLRAALGSNARQTALQHSWDAVFDSVYESYQNLLASLGLRSTRIEQSHPNECVTEPIH